MKTKNIKAKKVCSLASLPAFPFYSLPADAGSVADMVQQVAASLCVTIRGRSEPVNAGHVAAAKKALAAIGIKAK